MKNKKLVFGSQAANEILVKDEYRLTRKDITAGEAIVSAMRKSGSVDKYNNAQNDLSVLRGKLKRLVIRAEALGISQKLI